ncbi:MAG: hypothetical protein ACM3Q1_08875 [Bacteroidales bacterium]|jgi:hypothetical protein
MYEPLDRICLAPRAIAAAPVEYMVRKDGKPFAILNAPPALVQRTLAGFAQACPSASWSFERA